MLITISKAQKQVSDNLRRLRIAMNLTQKDLAERSGVKLPTLRKFEQKGSISLESFYKITMVLNVLEEVVKATEKTGTYVSIDDVLKETSVNYSSKKGRVR